MAVTVNRNLVFINSMQFMNSSLHALIKNFSDNDFKYLSNLFGDKLLKLVKQKGVYRYENMNSLKIFFDDRLLDRSGFYSSLKDECIIIIIIIIIINFFYIGSYINIFYKIFILQ